MFAEIRAATCSSSSRTTRSRGASSRSSSAAANDPDVIAHEGDGVSDERRVAARAGADRGVRGRQAVRVPGRDQGSRRRAAEHRVVESARARGRPRRLRLRQLEDPRQGDAHRPPRGRRPPPLRPYRHGQLPRGQRAHVRGLRAVHGGRGHRRRHRRPLQLPDRIRQAAGVPQGDRRAVRAALAPDRGDPQGGEGGRGRQARPHPDQGERAHPPGDHRRAVRRVAGGRADRPDRPRRSARCGPA